MSQNNRLLTGQAVILAAGESSRFWPLNHKHKSLFKFMGRALMCYKIENLKEAGIKEIIIVQKPEKDVENELKYERLPKDLRIKYVLQDKPLGTGHALKAAERYLKERFLVLNGDDSYEAEDIKKCLSKFPSILVKKMADPSGFGMILPKGNLIKRIVEKSETPPSNLVNIGCYFIPKAVLKEGLEKSGRQEYEITDYVGNLSGRTKVYFLSARHWQPLSYAWDLFDINEHLLSNIKTKIKARIEKNCSIKGPAVIEQGTVIKSGAYIEGPVYIGKNCQIGPNCFIRPYTSIEDNCVIGQAVEVKNSIISQDSHISHLSYVADSIIGENCNLGAGTILANLRFDEKSIHSIVKGKSVDTGRKKFGAVLDKGVKTGINVSIMPGVLIGQNAVIGPHSLVRENIGDNQIFYTKFQKIIK